MKSKTFSWITALAVVAAMTMPLRAAAQAQKEEHHRYRLIELGTFGGPNSYFTFITGRSINNRGLAIGSADTSMAVNPPFCLIDCYLGHAFRWQDGVLTDLDGLPGVSIPGSGPNDINAEGVITGIAFNGGVDLALGLPYFDAVVWKNGEIIDLGTFGGPLSYGNQSNDRGEAVGFALNTTPASFDLGDFCQNFPMPTQMRAFIWQEGVLRDLGTLGGTDSCALFVNERGQATGNSFTNSTVNPGTGLGVPTIHPFLWDRDEMRDLGALGKGTIATASGINNHGQVAGASNLADDLKFHAFLWEDGKLADLGSLGGDFVEVIGLSEKGGVVGKADLPGSMTHHAFLAENGKMSDLGSQDGNPCSVAISINAKSQIVGSSDDCSGNNAHAFFWQNGHMTDLNTLVPAGSDLTLISADFINDRGEIAAEGLLPNSDQRAVLLIPCQGDRSDDEGCQDTNSGMSISSRATAAPIAEHPAMIPSDPRPSVGPGEMLERFRARRTGRYHIALPGAPRN